MSVSWMTSSIYSLMNRKLKTGLLLSAVAIGCVASTQSTASDVSNVDSFQEDVVLKDTEVNVPKSWTCPTCTPEEQLVLKTLQEHTRITDRNALATIMGNIQQESRFTANICEGGARVPYHRCHSGGYGLIQWTTLGRYNGLGNFARKYNCDPSELQCQVRWMINEPQFQSVLPHFEGSGLTVQQYMNPAYRWLGWGIHGNRTHYSYDYVKMLTYA